MPDPARGARDQHPLTSGESPVHEQCLPGGQPAHRQSCGLDVAQPRRLRCKHLRRDDGVLGSHAVAIEGRERIHLVTGVDDDARKLMRRNRRQSINRPLQLVTRDRRRVHAHQYLARIGRRCLDLLDLQPAMVQPYRQHTAPPLPLLDFVPREILPSDPRNAGAGRASFGATGRSRRPLPRPPRAVLAPPLRADGRTRSAR